MSKVQAISYPASVESAFGALTSVADFISDNHRTDHEKSDFFQSHMREEMWEPFRSELQHLTDSNDHVLDTLTWFKLRESLIGIAAFQRHLNDLQSDDDAFNTYAQLYDEVIGKPCHTSFMREYIAFVLKSSGLDLARSTLLSIGCGTGIVEQQILKDHPIGYDNLMGIDLSESMIRVSSERIRSRVQNLMDLPESRQSWDMTYTGLNVFQYLDDAQYETAIRVTARITNPSGLYFGDFITPDHIRWYPHVIQSDNVISLRQPTIVEKNHNTYQQSEIINISRLQGGFKVTYEGKHLRYLPSLQKVRSTFSRYFTGQVDIYDALSLERVPESGETTPSTRYLLVARHA